MWRRTPSLRERVRVAGPDFFSDQELLELAFLSVMTAAKARRLARLLIDRFASFSDVVDAPRAELQTVPGMTDDALFRLALIKATAHRHVHGPVRVREKLGTPQAVKDYLAQTPSYVTTGLRVLFLDKKSGLIEDRHIDPVTVKAIIHAALQCGAMGLVLVGVDPATAEAIDSAGAPLKVTVKQFIPHTIDRKRRRTPTKTIVQADDDASGASAYQEQSARFGPEKKPKPSSEREE